MKYAEEILHLQGSEDPLDACNGQREVHCDTIISGLKREFPLLPGDYWTYLGEIGWGSFMDGTFSMFPSPLTLEELALTAAFPGIPARFVFFGTDISGDHAGFDITCTDDHVIELWHEDAEIQATHLTFRAYIRRQMGLRAGVGPAPDISNN